VIVGECSNIFSASMGSSKDQEISARKAMGI
jgi:hypothetical protein